MGKNFHRSPEPEVRTAPPAVDPLAMLDEARGLIADRAKEYDRGDAAEAQKIEQNFVRAASIASLKLNRAISAYEVVTILESVKDARSAGNPAHRDSHIDRINYAAFRAAFALKGEPK